MSSSTAMTICTVPIAHGDIVRFLAPDYKAWEIFAHIGGHPLGMAFDAAENLNVCIGGMGLYQVSPDRKVRKLTDETNRTMLSVIDDSRLKLADDLDIAPDGRIFFSEATIRYDMHDWATDALESRGNGRHDLLRSRDGSTKTILRNLQFPNGVCMAGDGQSFFFAETWGCRINRYWFDGPKKGTVRSDHPKPAGISRQHQPCIGREFLGGSGRHALAGARPGDADAVASQANGQARGP